jgi:hypothetical protein
MARPREFIEPKKTEQFTVRLEDDDALKLYREAARRELKPAVLLRKAALIGMAAMLAGSVSADNESSSGYAPLGDS